MTQQEPIIFSAGHKVNKANAVCLDLSGQGLTFCELDLAAQKVLHLAHYENDHDAESLLLANGLKALQLQAKHYDNTFINYAGKKFTLAPVALFDDKQARHMLEFNCGDTGSDMILTDDINSDIKLIYSMDESLKSTLDRLFPNHHLKHTATVLSRLMLQSEALNHEQVLLDISGGLVTIVAKKDQQLLLCNQYQVQADEDILYYVLFVLEQFDLNPMTVRLSISGQTATDSALSNALKKYIRQVRFVAGNKLLKRDDIPSMPHHHYFTTLNRLFCE